MIIFALNTGLRCGDIFKLQWKEVDFERRRLNAFVQKTRRVLIIPLNDAACAVLEAWNGHAERSLCVLQPDDR